MTRQTELTAEEYLEKEFPKGETKFRGQAMVLLALAKIEGREDAKQDFEKMIKAWDVEPCCHGIRRDELLAKLQIPTEKGAKGK